MKQNTIVVLVLCVIVGCALIAVGTSALKIPSANNSALSTNTDSDSLTTILVENPSNSAKEIQISLPGNATTGYKWSNGEVPGLTIKSEYVPTPTEHGLVGAGGNAVFNISAEKAGTYPFTAKYARSWEDNAINTYTQNLVFGDTDEKPFKLTYVGDINPVAGKGVKITTAGNPTTGFTWKATDNTQVKIISEKDVSSNDSEKPILGAGSMHEWLVTADKPGTYKFEAKYARSWEEKKAEKSFSFEITFV